MMFLTPWEANAQTTDTSTKKLVVYYSRTGNTQTVADDIAEATGADVFRIETEKPYPADYETMTQIAQEEKNRNARPAIKGRVDNLVQYNTIFVGSPTW